MIKLNRGKLPAMVYLRNMARVLMWFGVLLCGLDTALITRNVMNGDHSHPLLFFLFIVAAFCVVVNWRLMRKFRY